jgi:hypothetical protein
MMTQQEVRDLFDYDAESGELRWRIGKNAGRVAGAVNYKGYRNITVTTERKTTYRAHRLIWLWVYGEWPTPQIDHENLNKDDNRLSNLRLASCSQNLANQRGRRAKSGFKGVRRFGAKWQAAIHLGDKNYHLGMYPTPELAHAAYCEAAVAAHGKFARKE